MTINITAVISKVKHSMQSSLLAITELKNKTQFYLMIIVHKFFSSALSDQEAQSFSHQVWDTQKGRIYSPHVLSVRFLYNSRM
jgi:hypothetical protein